jgi:hypothetical protein
VTTEEFVSRLRRGSDKRLVFVNADSDTIHPGYHLTEIKAAKFDTVDCGGEKNRWNETIMQLWVPENEPSGSQGANFAAGGRERLASRSREADDSVLVKTEEEFMTAGKFLSIYEKVSKMIDVDLSAEVRFEYGDENFFPSNYHIESISEDDETLRVELRPPQTTCKARDRHAAGASCCC